MAKCWAVGICSPISTRGCICRSRVCGITLCSFLTWPGDPHSLPHPEHYNGEAQGHSNEDQGEATQHG